MYIYIHNVYIYIYIMCIITYNNMHIIFHFIETSLMICQWQFDLLKGAQYLCPTLTGPAWPLPMRFGRPCGSRWNRWMGHLSWWFNPSETYESQLG